MAFGLSLPPPLPTFTKIHLLSPSVICHPLFRADGNVVSTFPMAEAALQAHAHPHLSAGLDIDSRCPASLFFVSFLLFQLHYLLLSLSLPLFSKHGPSLRFSNCFLCMCPLLGILLTLTALIIISLLTFSYLLIHPFNR